MKPLRLQIEGFTAFRRPAVVDFRGRTLFAITGPTGAGKSSILDAMTWALYGAVPRVGRSTKQLITHGERSLRVQLEFEARGRTYRVARTTAVSGGGEARLEALADDGETWRPLADRAGDATERVTSILGLDYATFTKTIVLPQGEFASFLRGDDKDRRKILSALLGLETYVASGRTARQRARSAKEAASMLAVQIERLALGTPEAMAGIETERAELERLIAELEARRGQLERLEQATLAHLEARRALAAASETSAARARELAAARTAIEAIEVRRAALDGEIARLVAERAGARYDPAAHAGLRRAVELMEMRERAEATLARAQANLEGAGRRLEEARARHAGLEAEGRQAATAATGAGEVRAAASNAARDAAGGAAAVVTRLEDVAASSVAAAAEAERERVAAEQRLAGLERLAHALGELEAEEARVASAREAAEAAFTSATASVEASERVEAEAVAAVEASHGNLDAAMAANAAAALRARLRPGDVCPVCGEVITSLAEHDAAPDLEAARGALERAEVGLAAARRARDAEVASLERARATRDEAAAAVSRLAPRRVELAASLAEHGIASAAAVDALGVAIEGERAAGLDAAARGEWARAFAEATRAAGQVLERLVATAAAALGLEGLEVVPAALDRDDEAVLDGAERAGGELERTLAARQRAARMEEQAVEAARVAEEAAREGAEAFRLAEREQAAAALSVEAAASQLALITGGGEFGLVPPDATAEALRAALADAERLAVAAGALDVRLQEQRTALAVIGQQREDRADAVARLEGEAERAELAAEEAAAADGEATAAFERAWTALLESGAGMPAPDAARVPGLRHRLEERDREYASKRGALEVRIAQAAEQAAQAAEVRSEIAGFEGRARVASALEQELQADRFIAYVQREALAVLAADASSRLLHLTGERYRLEADAGEFVVIDQLNGDERRSVKTLSGGETFLASLALALALSERLPELAGNGGAMALESLFLDEGFGSLDAESLDVAIEGLERLAGGQRMIGVISHVPEIAERLPERIDVLKSPDSSRIAGAAAAIDVPPVPHLV